MRRAGLTTSILVAIGTLWGTVSTAAELKPSYLYNLSDFNGPLSSSSARVVTDRSKIETYVMTGDGISIYNENGMEIYRIEEDREVGRIHDLAVFPSGNLLLLVQREGAMRLIKASFRGEPIAELTLRGTPDEFSGFSPSRVKILDGSIYLLNAKSMQMIKTDQDGRVEKSVDIAKRLGFSDKERSENSISGFDVSRDGYMVVSEPVTARVHRISLIDDKVETFGKRGSAAGRFGVPSAVAVDSSGNILVADALRSMVLVFDRELAFVTEFGGRGNKAGAMASPDNLAIDRENRVYVSQKRSLGVTVFALQGA